MPLERRAGRVAPACATASLVLGGYLILWRFTYSRSLWLALEYALNPEP